MSISRAAIKQLTMQFGDPVTIRCLGKSGDLAVAAVRDHCERAMNGAGFLCVQGPTEGDLSVFALPAETPETR